MAEPPPRRGCLWNLGLSLFLLLAVAIGGVWFWGYLGHRAAQEKIAAIRQAGEPASPWWRS